MSDCSAPFKAIWHATYQLLKARVLAGHPFRAFVVLIVSCFTVCYVIDSSQGTHLLTGWALDRECKSNVVTPGASPCDDSLRFVVYDKFELDTSRNSCVVLCRNTPWQNYLQGSHLRSLRPSQKQDAMIFNETQPLTLWSWI